MLRKIFPSVLHVVHNQPVNGKVFTVPFSHTTWGTSPTAPIRKASPGAGSERFDFARTRSRRSGSAGSGATASTERAAAPTASSAVRKIESHV